MAQGTKTYFRNFFDEKEIPFAQWTIESKYGFPNFINSEFIIETLQGMENNTPEAVKIRGMLMKIDFLNKPVLPFLRALAGSLVGEKV